MKYRRRAYSDCWHWMHACTHWPVFPKVKLKSIVEQERGGRPTTGELCNQCLAKDRAK